MRQSALLLFLLWIAATPAAATPCRPVEGLAAVIAPRSIVIFGEVHGTVEAPAFVANALCHALAAGHKVTLALEHPIEERERLTAFLLSDGSPADREAFLAGPFWTGGFEDGRSSQAMFALIDETRRLKKSGQPLELFVFDSMAYAEDRDRQMGNTLRAAIDAAPDRLFLVLTGNLHSQLTGGREGDATFVPMGFTVKEGLKDRRIVALDVSASGGEFWGCFSLTDCGPKVYGGKPQGEDWKVSNLEAEPILRGHHGRYHVGTFHASPPQVPKTP